MENVLILADEEQVWAFPIETMETQILAKAKVKGFYLANQRYLYCLV